MSPINYENIVKINNKSNELFSSQKYQARVESK